ncbi:hypothetical protein [Nocardia thailandica]
MAVSTASALGIGRPASRHCREASRAAPTTPKATMRARAGSARSAHSRLPIRVAQTAMLCLTRHSMHGSLGTAEENTRSWAPVPSPSTMSKNTAIAPRTAARSSATASASRSPATIASRYCCSTAR